MEDIEFEEVVETWGSAGGKDTLGVLQWFGGGAVDRWSRGTIRAGDVAQLRFIGGGRDELWTKLSNGTYLVASAAQHGEHEAGFRWDSSWHIIVISDPETGARTILDGNTRALQLVMAVNCGEIGPDVPIGIIEGQLSMITVHIGKTAASLWR